MLNAMLHSINACPSVRLTGIGCSTDGFNRPVSVPRRMADIKKACLDRGVSVKNMSITNSSESQIPHVSTNDSH